MQTKSSDAYTEETIRNALEEALSVLQALEWRWDKDDENDAPGLGGDLRAAIQNARAALSNV